jgi:hypothetical protein
VTGSGAGADDSLASTLRIAIEKRGYIGFVTVYEDSTLTDVRHLIDRDLDGVPRHYAFVLEDGVPISKRQEGEQRALNFLPCARLRPIAGPIETEKVIVVHAVTRAEYASWITRSYTFGDLRRDASRFWRAGGARAGRAEAGCALQDEEGCVWPEGAHVLRVLSQPQHRGSRLILAPRVGAVAGGEAEGDDGLGVAAEGRAARVGGISTPPSSSISGGSASVKRALDSSPSNAPSMAADVGTAGRHKSAAHRVTVEGSTPVATGSGRLERASQSSLEEDQPPPPHPLPDWDGRGRTPRGGPGGIFGASHAADGDGVANGVAQPHKLLISDGAKGNDANRRSNVLGLTIADSLSVPECAPDGGEGEKGRPLDLEGELVRCLRPSMHPCFLALPFLGTSCLLSPLSVYFVITHRRAHRHLF